MKKALSFITSSAFIFVLTVIAAMAAPADHPCHEDNGGHLYRAVNSDVHDCMRDCGYLPIDNRHDGHRCEALDHWPPLNCTKCDWKRPDAVACGVCDPCIRDWEDCALDCCPVCSLCGDCDRCNASDPEPEIPAEPEPVTTPDEPAVIPAEPEIPSDESAEPPDESVTPPVIETGAGRGGTGGDTGGSGSGGVNFFTIALAGLTAVVFAAAAFGATVLKKANG
ncbi:MAG: hypothetical protein FWE74_04725 [Oscillospiraceae bacterium]|nr:hypothetical protein [Oscillospiraceae bacterium]